MKLYLDIETIPSQQQWVKDQCSEEIIAPGNYKKQESIQKWMEENAEIEAEKKWRKTSLVGSVGEIICISYAVDDYPVNTIGRKLGESEKEMLESFCHSVVEQLKNKSGSFFTPTWVGHNICEFDLRFLWQRIIINKANNSGLKIPHNEKPWSDKVFDTFYEWTGGKSTGYGSLDSLCKVFNLKQKGDLDGSKVWDFIQDGKYGQVFDYCADDVERVRKLSRLMED